MVRILGDPQRCTHRTGELRVDSAPRSRSPSFGEWRGSREARRRKASVGAGRRPVTAIDEPGERRSRGWRFGHVGTEKRSNTVGAATDTRTRRSVVGCARLLREHRTSGDCRRGRGMAARRTSPMRGAGGRRCVTGTGRPERTSTGQSRSGAGAWGDGWPGVPVERSGTDEQSEHGRWHAEQSRFHSW